MSSSAALNHENGFIAPACCVRNYVRAFVYFHWKIAPRALSRLIYAVIFHPLQSHTSKCLCCLCVCECGVCAPRRIWWEIKKHFSTLRSCEPLEPEFFCHSLFHLADSLMKRGKRFRPERKISRLPVPLLLFIFVRKLLGATQFDTGTSEWAWQLILKW